MTIHSEQRVMTPSKMTWLLCWCKFFDDNTVDDFVSFVERSSVDVKNLLCSLNAAGKGADITHRRMTCSLLFWVTPQSWSFLRDHFHHFYLLVSKNGFPHFLKSILMYLYFVIIFIESFQASLSATSIFFSGILAVCCYAMFSLYLFCWVTLRRPRNFVPWIFCETRQHGSKSRNCQICPSGTQCPCRPAAAESFSTDPNPASPPDFSSHADVPKTNPFSKPVFWLQARCKNFAAGSPHLHSWI